MMSHLTKENILSEIRRTAQKNGGVPLGLLRFEKETGIKRYECQKIWPKFGDAQREAGFAPNVRQAAYGKENLFEKIVGFMRELGHFPTKGELMVKHNSDTEFPSVSAVQRRGNKGKIAKEIAEYAAQKGYGDIVQMCESIIKGSKIETGDKNLNVGQNRGWVYLFKSGRYYKIGKTNDVERRKAELQNGLLQPEPPKFIHTIETDDQTGIEAYWHNRFKEKRKKGEFFQLNAEDVKAFKRWKRIF